jgi:hypothetical protein
VDSHALAQERCGEQCYEERAREERHRHECERQPVQAEQYEHHTRDEDGGAQQLSAVVHRAQRPPAAGRKRVRHEEHQCRCLPQANHLADRVALHEVFRDRIAQRKQAYARGHRDYSAQSWFDAGLPLRSLQCTPAPAA